MIGGEWDAEWRKCGAELENGMVKEVGVRWEMGWGVGWNAGERLNLQRAEEQMGIEG